VVPIGVLLAQTRNDVLAGAIAESIRNAADFTLVVGNVVDVGELDALLPELLDTLDVLIIVGDEGAPDVKGLLAQHPSLLVSHISIRADAVHLDLTRVGLDQLLGAMRALARKPGAEAGERALEYEVVAHRSIPEVRARDMAEQSSDSEELMDAVLAWVDATLLYHHRKQPVVDAEFAGLARSAASIESALSRSSSQGGDAVERAASAADEATQRLELACTRGVGRPHPIVALRANLGLRFIELKALLLGLAAELDPRYHGVFGFLQDDLGRRTASMGLICAMLGDPAEIRRELARSAGLLRWRLLENGLALPYADEAVRLDPTLIAWLLGDAQALMRDLTMRRLVRSDAWIGGNWLYRQVDVSLARRLSRLLARVDCRAEWIVLAGEDSDGWFAMLEHAASEAQVPLLRIGVSTLSELDMPSAADAVVRTARAARLLEAVPVLDATQCAKPESAPHVLKETLEALGDFRGTGIIVMPDVQRMISALPRGKCNILHRQKPDGTTLGAAFAAAAAQFGLQLSADEAVRLGESFPVSLAQIDDSVRLAMSQGAGLLPPADHFSALSQSSRRVAAADLPHFARRIDPIVELEEVVLPKDRSAQLHEIVTHIEQAPRVLGTWGFGAKRPHLRGVAALFSGPSGTGKSMAAQGIAKALKTQLYIVDLSRVVSKYLGESERNLNTVFCDAEKANAVLLFDEADALFGKRSEIKDAHDRYANLEVAYLLQRMEEFSGLAILTTNFRQNLDQAFLRRLRFVVEFPKPDVEAREEIWRQCLPEAAPKSADVDLKLLARRLELTGGSICQITLRAAFAASVEKKCESIGMRHIIAATRAELLKIGMPSAERDLAEFTAALKPRDARAA
jgi:AAA+ superfamily predicted ATPase